MSSSLKTYQVVEFDRDYRIETRRFTLKFSSAKEAEQWAKDASWMGYEYFVKSKEGEGHYGRRD